MPKKAPRNAKKALLITGVAVLVVALGAVLGFVLRPGDDNGAVGLPSPSPEATSPGTSEPTDPPDPEVAPEPWAGDSAVWLTNVPGAKVIVTEFFDFECGYCAVFHPLMTELREKYGDQVSFVARNYLISSHVNTLTSALAAAAAHQQGQYAQMSNLLFERIGDWGGQATDQSDVFRSYAEELGLDMAAYDAAVADPATTDWVLSSVDAGTAVGVQGTPSFFINSTKLEITDAGDIEAAIVEALAQ